MNTRIPSARFWTLMLGRLAFAFAIRQFALISLTFFVPLGAFATEQIDAGKLERFSYRNNYILFRVSDGTTNYCAPCGADPAAYASGAYCWVQTSNTSLVSLLLSVEAQGKSIVARVVSWTDCRVYQLRIMD